MCVRKTLGEFLFFLYYAHSELTTDYRPHSLYARQQKPEEGSLNSNRQNIFYWCQPTLELCHATVLLRKWYDAIEGSSLHSMFVADPIFSLGSCSADCRISVFTFYTGRMGRGGVSLVLHQPAVDQAPRIAEAILWSSAQQCGEDRNSITACHWCWRLEVGGMTNSGRASVPGSGLQPRLPTHWGQQNWAKI